MRALIAAHPRAQRHSCALLIAAMSIQRPAIAMRSAWLQQGNETEGSARVPALGCCEGSIESRTEVRTRPAAERAIGHSVFAGIEIEPRARSEPT
jgi:hypothetical protein